MPRFSILSFLLIALPALPGATSLVAQTEASSTTSHASIELEQIAPARWRATYRLDEPASRLEFQRPAGFYREAVWTVVTPGYRFARDGDMQVVEAEDGSSPRAEIVVEFDEYTEQLTREYEPFVRFSDGGRAIYTGHLYARPDSADTIRTLEMAPAAGERLVLRGGVHEGPTRWTDEDSDGTYVYFGVTEPLETEDVITVFDRGLPDWVRDEFDAWLPRLFATYRERLGQTLPWKPLVLYGHQERGDQGYSYGGGTLSGLIQLTLSGEAWETDTPRGRELALGFLAHEISHLWNGQLTTNEGRDPWIHEGAADAMADRLLHELGVYDDAALGRRREEAINACFLRLGSDVIKTSRDPRVAYECGQVVALWTELAARDGGFDGDLFDFWRLLIESALANEGVYDIERYLDVAASIGVSPAVGDRMRGALEGPVRDPVPVLTRGLIEAGLTLVAAEPPPSFRTVLARRAVIHVMSSACGGRFSFTGVTAFTTFAIDGCEPFEAELQVTRINGFETATDGAAIYDSIVAACAGGGDVVLEGEGSRTVVPCSTRLRPRPPWYEIAQGGEPVSPG